MANEFHCNCEEHGCMMRIILCNEKKNEGIHFCRSGSIINNLGEWKGEFEGVKSGMDSFSSSASRILLFLEGGGELREKIQLQLLQNFSLETLVSRKELKLVK